MAESKPVQSNEIIQDNLFLPTKKDAEELTQVLEKMELAFERVRKETIKLASEKRAFESVEEIEQHTKALYENEKAIQALNKISKVKIQIQQQTVKSTVKSTKTTQEKTAAEIKQEQLDKKASAERLKRLKAEAILENQNAGRLEKLRASNILLRLEVEKLTGAEEDYAERLTTLNAKIDENNRLIDESSDKQTRQRNNVGGYEAAINSAAQSTGLFGQALQKTGEIYTTLNNLYDATIENIGVLRESLAELRKGKQADAASTEAQSLAANKYDKNVKKATISTKLFNNVLKAGVIGSLLLLVGGAVSFFSKFESGLDTLDKFSGRVQAIFGVVAGRLGKFFQAFLGLVGAVGDGFTKFSLNIKRLALETQKFLGKDVGGELEKIDKKLAEIDAKTSAGEFLSQMRKSFEGVSEEIKTQIELSDALVKRIDDYGRTARLLELRLARLTSLEAQLNQIVSDGTLSFRAQESAQLRLAKISEERAKLELANNKELLEQEILKIARNNAVSVNEVRNAVATQQNTEKVREKDLQSLLEFQKNVIASETELDTVRQEIEKRNRERLQKEFLLNVKITTDQNKIQLDAVKKIAENSNNSLQVRAEAERKFAEESERIYRKLVNDFQQRTAQKVDAQELANTASATELEQKLLNLDLDEQSTDKLNDVIKNYREQVIILSELQQKRKQDEQAIKDRDKAARQSILTENITFEIEQLQKQLKLQESNGVQTIATSERIFSKRRQLLIEQAKFELKNDKLTGDERLAIENKLQNDLARLELERIDTTDSVLKQQLDKVQNYYKQVSDALKSALDERSKLQSDFFAAETRERDRQLSRQEARAAAGFDNTLAFEEQKAAEAEQANKDRLKREAQVKQAAAFADAFSAAYVAALSSKNEDGTPLNSGQALQRAFVAAGAGRAVASGLVQFLNEGTDFVQQKGPKSILSKGKDTVDAVLQVGEAVIPTEQNLQNRAAVSSLVDGSFKAKFAPKSEVNTGVNMVANLMLQTNKQLLSEIQKLNAKPVQQVAVDTFGNLIETTYKAGVTAKITYKNRFARK